MPITSLYNQNNFTDQLMFEFTQALDGKMTGFYTVSDKKKKMLYYLVNSFDFTKPHSFEEWKDFISAIEEYDRDDYCGFGYSFRGVFTKFFSWSIPAKEAIDAIKTFVGDSTINEYMSGSAYWAYLMQNEGINIIPSDLSYNPKQEENKKWVSGDCLRKNFVPMVEKDIRAVGKKEIKGKVVMLSWIPCGSNMANNLLLKMYKGQKLILVGEGEGGCTGSDKFFGILKDSFEEVKVSKKKSYFPCFSGLWDDITFWQKVV